MNKHGRSQTLNVRKLFGPLLILALLLSACGGAPAQEAPTAAPAAAAPTAAAAAPTAATPPTPTFEPVTDVGKEPTVAAAPTAAPVAAISGALSWRDQVLRNDQVVVAATG